MIDTPRTLSALPDLLTAGELAGFLGISMNSLYFLRMTPGALPPAIKLGKQLRFRRADVAGWLDAQVAA